MAPAADLAIPGAGPFINYSSRQLDCYRTAGTVSHSLVLIRVGEGGHRCAEEGRRHSRHCPALMAFVPCPQLRPLFTRMRGGGGELTDEMAADRYGPWREGKGSP
jgi:hypothetical protein